ncbi:uncharacterized protein LOC122624604 [Drosophila teissieri]|uniref:uncharacterized protein LOC122624604 n=1 Tax=Drosophila teissieri TaxID=7243 RepID=UPI001CBA4D5D|nr:uncharacterized protein LOC122624604 [Drosophila teissieri]
MYNNENYLKSLRPCRHCCCSWSRASPKEYVLVSGLSSSNYTGQTTECSPRSTCSSSVRTRSIQKGLKYRYEGYEVEESWCSDPRCSICKEFPVSGSQRTRKSQQTRNSLNSRKREPSRYSAIPQLPLESGEENYDTGVQYTLSQSESSTSSSSSSSTSVSRYREDGPKSSERVKSSGKCSCACSKPERQPRTISLRSAEEIKKAVRSQIAVLKKIEECDCSYCKPASERTMQESAAESEKPEPQQNGHHANANDAANDLVRTEIIDPMIRRLQRVYLNNKIHELGILDSLYDMMAQIKEVYRKRGN